MPRRTGAPGAVALRVDHLDVPSAVAAMAARIAALGGALRTLSTVRRLDGEPPSVEVELEAEGVDEATLMAALRELAEVREIRPTRTLDRVFGKRVIVIGGGAQVAQVALGAVSEADRHNLRGERISVDTIPLVGEENIATAVRAASRAHRSASRMSDSDGPAIGSWRAQTSATTRSMAKKGIRPCKKASTATSLAAFNTAGAVPPRRPHSYARASSG